MGTDKANSLYRRARAKMAAGSKLSEFGVHAHGILNGGFNHNVRIADYNIRFLNKKNSQDVPIAWSPYSEVETLELLGGLRGRVPEILYADPGGRFMIQKWEHARDLERHARGLPDKVPLIYFERVARIWRDLQEVPLPDGPPADRPLQEPLRKMLAEHGTRAPFPSRVPATLTDYRALLVHDIEARYNMIRSTNPECADYLARRFGFPERPDQHVGSVLETLSDVPLALAHPDLHMRNLGVKNGRQWEPFFFDVEFVGPRDPRHALATMLHLGRYSEAKATEIVRAHEKEAPDHLRQDFHRNVRTWQRVTAAHVTVQKFIGMIGFVEEQAAQPSPGSRIEKNPTVDFVRRRVNSAASVWGAPQVDRDYVVDTLREAIRMRAPKGKGRKSSILIAYGFGPVPTYGTHVSRHSHVGRDGHGPPVRRDRTNRKSPGILR